MAGGSRPPAARSQSELRHRKPKRPAALRPPPPWGPLPPLVTTTFENTPPPPEPKPASPEPKPPPPPHPKSAPPPLPEPAPKAPPPPEPKPAPPPLPKPKPPPPPPPPPPPDDVLEFKLDILNALSELQRQNELLLSEFRQDRRQQDELRRQNSYLPEVVLGVGLVAVPLGIGLIISPPSATEHLKHWALWAVYYAAQAAEIILGIVMVIIFRKSFQTTDAVQSFDTAVAVQRRRLHTMGKLVMILSLVPAILTILLVGLAKYA